MHWILAPDASSKPLCVLLLLCVHFQPSESTRFTACALSRMMRTPSKCSLKGELWSRQQLNASLEQFSAIFERRPKSNNAGGGGLNHAFALWHTLHTLQPKAVIESGVLYGQGTWLARQALGPDALIHALDPCDFDAKRSGNWIDPNPRTKYWRGSRFTDLGSINWTAIIPDRSVRQSTLVILDDHMSAIKRIAQLIPHDFQHVWYDDNWNGRAMDCYSFNAICSPVARGDSNTSMNASLDYFDNFKKVRFRIPLAEHFANLQFLLGHLQDYFEYPTLFGICPMDRPLLSSTQLSQLFPRSAALLFANPKGPTERNKLHFLSLRPPYVRLRGPLNKQLMRTTTLMVRPNYDWMHVQVNRAECKS